MKKNKPCKLEQARLKLEHYANFETKKSVHINLTKPTHTEFRKVLFDHDLSMQEVFEWFAHQASAYDPRAISIMKEAKINKRARTLNGLAAIKMDDIYDALSEINPLSED